MSAIGIVFGDIGTSPIYAFRETFSGHHDLANGPIEILGVLSLIFWSMMIVVTLKYVAVIMRADNKGEGGSLALLALINRKTSEGGKRRRWTAGIILLGVFACSLFYGDSMITPAISVLSAVEGLITVQAGFEPYVVPIALGHPGRPVRDPGDRHGPGRRLVRADHGPLFPDHLGARHHAHRRPADDHPRDDQPARTRSASSSSTSSTPSSRSGSVVLAVTGAEALYADMGHFGRKPIGISWLFFVMPALMLNYMGQGAMVIQMDNATADATLHNPFFLLAPESLRLPLVILATFATIIASQAVISGAFSVTQQAMHLGFIPRLRIRHTSEAAVGQIYIPVINWALLIAVIMLVLFFQNSSNLAAAYGIAVTGAMFIDTCLLTVVLFVLWKWKPWLAIPTLAVFFTVDIAYFAANLTKVPHGGWFPLLVGVIAFTLLTTWARGRQLMIKRMNEAAMPASIFIKSAASSATRVPGTAVFMTTAADGIPHALLHNLKHNKVLHERVLLLTVKIEDVPYVEEQQTFHLQELGQGFFRLIVRYGFMQETNVPAALARVDSCGPQFKMMDTSFFLARQTLIASPRPGMAIWREKLFAWMLRNAESAMEFFSLPPNRVVELGSQVEI